MTPIRYYKLCFVLPIVLPLSLVCVALPTWFLGFPLGANGLGVIGPLAYILGSSLAVGGVPYVAMVVVLLRVFRQKSADWYPKFFFVLPILFAAVMGVGGTIFQFVFDGTRNAIGTGFALAGGSIFFGYPYVFLALAGYTVLHRLGFIQEDPVV
jgi:hypothetical protein